MVYSGLKIKYKKQYLSHCPSEYRDANEFVASATYYNSELKEKVVDLLINNRAVVKGECVKFLKAIK